MNFALVLLLLADAWPQWRGPARDGHASSFAAPAKWPEKLVNGWTLEVGEGYSSPVSDGTVVCVHSRRGEEEIVSCADLVTGRLRWSDKYSAPFKKNSYAGSVGSGPFATPLLADGRLFTLGVNAVLSAYDASSGKLLWRQQPDAVPSTAQLFCGTAASPMLEGGRLIVLRGDHRAGELAALDPSSGKKIWSYSRETPAYASPVAATIGGLRQFVLLGEKSVVGVSGDGKELWRFPFLDEYRENIATPVVKDDLVFVSGTRLNSHGLRVTREGSGWKATEVWTNTELPLYMSSPVLDGDHLYGLSSKKKGQLFGLNLKTGKKLWTSEGRFAEQASVFAAGPYLLVFTVDGQMIVAVRDPAQYQEIRRYELTGGQAYSSPVLAGKRIVVKDASHLRSFSLP